MNGATFTPSQVAELLVAVAKQTEDQWKAENERLERNWQAAIRANNDLALKLREHGISTR